LIITAVGLKNMGELLFINVVKRIVVLQMEMMTDVGKQEVIVMDLMIIRQQVVIFIRQHLTSALRKLGQNADKTQQAAL
jgi:hypothetical protein